MTEKETPEWNKKNLGKTFKRNTEIIQGYVESLDQEALTKLRGELAQG